MSHCRECRFVEKPWRKSISSFIETTMCRNRARTIRRETAHRPLAGRNRHLSRDGIIIVGRLCAGGEGEETANTRVDADRWMELADHLRTAAG